MKSAQQFSQSNHSVSRYISGLREGNEEASQRIWEKFFRRLIQLANLKLKNSPRHTMDEEDVVQQVFAEFFVQVQSGRFPKLHDRHDLWQVLAMLVDRRATDQIRKQNTLRGGGRRVINETTFLPECGVENRMIMSSIPSNSPSPSEVVDFVDVLADRLLLLEEHELREVAILKLKGYSNREIAGQLTSSLRTIERMLNRIRSLWKDTWQ